MAEWWEWTGEPGPWQANEAPAMWAGGSPTFDESGGNYWNSPAYQQFTGWGDPTGVGSSGDQDFTGEGSGGLWGSILGGLGSVGSFLGNNASWLGPLASAGGSIAGGALGSQASSDAARLQADALNRGIDLQTAQWLQQQANQAPWLQAGQQALPQLQQLAGQGPQAPFQGPGTLATSDYGLPTPVMGWGPQAYQGPAGVDPGAYRYTPGQGPSAANYRYTPGQTPDAAQYQSGPPQLYQGAMPGTQVSTLTGQQVLDQDPGYQFRQDQARKALEASALAKGMGMSGSTLGALQRQSQDLASQEYGQAYNRMMGRDIEQYGRDWGQYQQRWNQGVQGTQLGLQTNAQHFGQAMSAAQLREQVNQVATQQGWSQAQAEAAFREQLAQQASQQGFGQALAGQQAAFGQGLQAQQWNQQQRQQADETWYNRLMGQNQLTYGRDLAANQAQYDRALQAYNSQLQGQQTQWNRLAALSGVGQTSADQLGKYGYASTNQIGDLLAKLGTAQGTGAAGEGLAWNRALGGAVNQLPSILAGLNA